MPLAPVTDAGAPSSRQGEASAPRPRTRALAYGALVLTAALWASSAVTARGLMENLPPVTLAFLRWSVVLLALAPFAWIDRKAIANTLRTRFSTCATLALTGFAPQTCLVYFGLVGSTATVLGLLNSAIPVMIVALMATWRGRRPRPLESLGLAISLAGVLFILARGDPLTLTALRFSAYDLLLIAGMAVWAFYTIKLTERPNELSMPAFIFATGVLGLVFASPLLAIELLQRGLPSLAAGELIGIVYLGTLPTLAALMLFAHGVSRVGPVQAGIFTHLVPLFTAAFAAAFLGERLHAFHAVGFLLVAGGAILCCLYADPMLSSRSPARMPPAR